MEQKFWLERWEKGETGWHRDEVHPELPAHWPLLALPAKARVFVPLCGASPDMAWLAAQGHEVIGVELSRLAIEAFLARHRVKHIVMEDHGFRTYLGGRYQIWQGDLFALPDDALAGIDAVYDRASLVALPEEMRRRYARFLAERIAPGVPGLLISFSYDQNKMSGPPFSVPASAVDDLLAADFDITALSNSDALDESLKKRGLTAVQESSYLLRRKSTSGDRA